MLLQIATRKVDPDITVVELTGRLALGRESQQVENLIQDLLKKGTQRLVYDLTNLNYTDSTGIGIIAFSAGQVRNSGGEIRIAGAKGLVADSLKISGLNTIIGMDSNVEEASKNLGGSAGAGA